MSHMNLTATTIGLALVLMTSLTTDADDIYPTTSIDQGNSIESATPQEPVAATETEVVTVQQPGTPYVGSMVAAGEQHVFPMVITHKRRRAIVTLKPGENLLKLIQGAKGGALLDFYADWCGPCHVQSDILRNAENTALKYDTSIIKVNVDQHPALADRLRISGLPTLMRIKDGKIVARRTGLTDPTTIADLLAR